MATEEDIRFDHDEYVVRLGLRGVYFVIGGLNNRTSSRALDAWVEETVQDVLDDHCTRTLTDSAILCGYRDLHSAVGASNKRNVSSPESLLRTLLRTKTLPRINAIVDIYNVWSLKTLLALGAHDVSGIDSRVSLGRLAGDERFVPLGMAHAKPVKCGEYGYVDAANDVICRMETRQVEKTKVTLDTRACFFIVQGNSETSSDEIRECADEVARSLALFCGAYKPRFLGEI